MEDVAGGASPQAIVYVCVMVNPHIYYIYCVTLYVRYVEVISDGDAKIVQRLNEVKQYGDDMDIVKYECVGHVQKFVGMRLWAVKRVSSIMHSNSVL